MNLLPHFIVAFIAFPGAMLAAEAPPRAIGVANMQADGTIVMQLRAEDPSGIVGDATIVVKPGHKDYEEMLDHLGGLKPGESKPVPSWPEASRAE